MADIEALLFDLGGVVIGIDFHKVFSAWAADAGRPVSDVAAGFTFGEIHQRHEVGVLDDAGFFQATSDALGLGLPVQRMAHGWAQIFTGPVPGMQPLLAALAPRWPLFLFSNTNPAHHRQWSAEFGDVVAPFRRMFLSHTLGLRKPDAAAFEAVAAQIGVPLPRILFFDDTLANVEGARAVGMPAAHVRNADDVRAALRLHGIDPEAG